MRISMLAECFEALGKRLEKEKKIIVKSENNTTRTVQCENCKEKLNCQFVVKSPLHVI